MKILVTGSAGFIGSHLAERLAMLGHQVLGVDCLTDYYSLDQKRANVRAIQEAGVTFHKLDLAEADLAPMVSGVDGVIHAAAQPGISSAVSFWEYQRNNVTATQRLLAAAANNHSLDRFIYISTSSVYGYDATGDEETVPRPASYYGVTKLAAEQLVLSRFRDAGFPACALRLFSVYGPRERADKLYTRLISAILRDREFPLYEGSLAHRRSYTYIADAVDGVMLALGKFDKCKGEIFNIGTDASATTEEGIRTVEEITGKRARFNHLPRRPGDQLRTQANIHKARRILGYDPQVPLREGLEAQVRWLKSKE
jgi:UDP-glucuronate 4-epimerase